MRIESRTSDSKSNTLHSELTWYLLVGLRLWAFYIYSHALFILTKSSKAKNQMMHDQKFKDSLGSTCQIRSERRVLDLELEIPGLILIGGTNLSLELFVFMS